MRPPVPQLYAANATTYIYCKHQYNYCTCNFLTKKFPTSYGTQMIITILSLTPPDSIFNSVYKISSLIHHTFNIHLLIYTQTSHVVFSFHVFILISRKHVSCSLCALHVLSIKSSMIWCLYYYSVTAQIMRPLSM